MQTRGSINKSPIKLSMQQKINWHGDLFTNWENLHGKKPHRVILKSPLPKFHYYHNKRLVSKGIPVPYTNLQLNPYPNTQLDLFCSDNFSFWCTAPKYVTNQLRGSQYVTSITN